MRSLGNTKRLDYVIKNEPCTTTRGLDFRMFLYSVGELCNAILAGLVSITAGCDGVTDWGAFLIGFIGAFWYILGKKLQICFN